jgi:hypothetical protein
MYYFSKSFLSFYNDKVTLARHIPKDALEITKATYDAMMTSIANGLVIKAGHNGLPVAAKPATHQLKESLKDTTDRYNTALFSKIHALAREWGFESAHAAVSYLHSHVDHLAAEAAMIMKYRDTAHHNAQVLTARIHAGTSELPASVPHFLAIVLPPTPIRPTSEQEKHS